LTAAGSRQLRKKDGRQLNALHDLTSRASTDGPSLLLNGLPPTAFSFLSFAFCLLPCYLPAYPAAYVPDVVSLKRQLSPAVSQVTQFATGPNSGVDHAFFCPPLPRARHGADALRESAAGPTSADQARPRQTRTDA